MPLLFLVASASKWLTLAALATLLGGLVIEVGVLGGGSPEVAAARRRLENWSLVAVIGLLVATMGEFVVRVQTMSDGPFATMILAVPAVLIRTHFGPIWIVRAGLLAVTAVLCLQRFRRWRAGALVATGAVALSTSLTGHAAQWGDLSLSVAADWVHLVASGIWGGGLCALSWVVFRAGAMRTSPPFASMMSRFSRLAGFCVLAVVLSGICSSWVQVGSIRALGTTDYGRVLLAKVLIVGALVYLGAGNRYALLPRLTGTTATGPGAQLYELLHSIPHPRRALSGAAAARLVVRIRIEAVLALVVFACAALLAESTPARHQGHTPHSSDPAASQAGAHHPLGAGPVSPGSK
jgi:copper resistance protein D